MKKILVSVLFLLSLCIIFSTSKAQAMQNPWVDCGADFECATKVSGITFPLRLSNYWIRAMQGMIEVSYPFDEFRDVAVRKTVVSAIDDISGVYTKYPINRKIKLKNGIMVSTRGSLSKIYVMNMSADTGYYSAFCEKGMSKKEAQGVYDVIREAENPELPAKIIPNKYSSCELGDLVGDDVKRIKYNEYKIDYHKKDFNKKEIIKLADECLLEGVSNQREMDCCMTIKMYQ